MNVNMGIDCLFCICPYTFLLLKIPPHDELSILKRACHKPLSFDNVKLECVNSQIFFKLKQWKAFTDYF